MSEKLDANGQMRALAFQFKGGLNWQVSVRGDDCLVVVPDADKLELLIFFDDFKLKGSNAYIKVEKAGNDVEARGRMWIVRERATGVPKEMSHFEGICELGAMIGVDNVDMQFLHD